VKRIDLLNGTRLLAKKKIEESNGTLMLATSYCEGQRLGDITASWEDWLDEDIDEDEVEDVEAELADPTEEDEVPPPNVTKWPTSVTSSKDSVQAPTGT
jgi:hypothetical protein